MSQPISVQDKPTNVTCHMSHVTKCFLRTFFLTLAEVECSSKYTV